MRKNADRNYPLISVGLTPGLRERAQAAYPGLSFSAIVRLALEQAIAYPIRIQADLANITRGER